MPSIINLGTTERLPSHLSGLSEGLARGMETGVNIQNIREREKERVTREKIAEQELSSRLVDQELRKREQDIQNVRKTHEQFSMWWNSMDDQQKAIARTSEQYKEMQKFFKSFKDLAPGMVADNGDIVASSNSDIYKKKLEENVAKAKINIAEGKGTDFDTQLLAIDQNIGADTVSKALAAATEQVTTGQASMEDLPGIVQDTIRNSIEGFKGALKPIEKKPRNPFFLDSGIRTGLSQGLSQPVAPAPEQAPVLNPHDTRDPLGLYK